MKRLLIVAIVIVIVLGGYLAVNAIFTKSYEIPTTPAVRGTLVIGQRVSGVVDAARAFTISAPRIRGLQITWMAPEGSRVNEGDPVLKFDASQQISELNDQRSSLKINQASLDRARQELNIQKKNLELDLQRAQRKYDEMKHEAPKLAEEARLELELAELSYQAKMDQLESDVQKAELEVSRAQEKVNMSEKELAQMSIDAPIPGMVVYLEIWKGSQMGKVQEGDSPWPGQGLINLPDLSEMVVNATVSEVDAAKVDSGQAVIITLDALPDTSFNGVVVQKGTLARRKDPSSKINVFDVEIAIADKDTRLKPGMSASCQIVVDRLENAVHVPLEAVFEKEGQTVVYLENKSEIEVTVGRRNDMEIQILEGLDGDERICLIDPTLDEPELPGERATEPELNKGRQLPSESPQSRGRRRGN